MKSFLVKQKFIQWEKDIKKNFCCVKKTASKLIVDNFELKMKKK